MKRLLLLATAALAAASFNAVAHGDHRPLHGGIVNEAADLQFELVPHPGGAALYLVDHGKPVATAGMTGKLTVLSGTAKSEAELKPAGDNKLEAAGVTLAPGSKVVASLAGARAKTVTVRFTVK